MSAQWQTPSSKPIGICGNCLATWRAAKPRPAAVFCHHLGNAARLEAARWRVLEAISDRTVAEMRKAGEL